MGMRRAGRPELEHRQVRTEFEHQRCELRLAMGGEAVRDEPHETYYCQLKSHDPAGRDSYATFTRKTARISSYQDDAIKTTVETWADGIPWLE
ncbi:hypothetical protein [Methanoculleus nereidis]|uniref:hypothetical protein n=1 Tax=Methanoculleus nereidis TaxID=2735141 RepID=UPI002941FF6C|nr:hypothetical protein [Methanoculleus sp. YWC-01]